MGDAKEFVVIIVGAGPAGLAAEVYINTRYKERVKKEAKKKNPKGVPTLKTIIIEKSDVTAPLWRKHAYDNLTLQGPKSTCQLPGQKFHDECPEFPRRRDFIDYLDKYVGKLTNDPNYNEEVTKAERHPDGKGWLITTQKHPQNGQQPPETKTYFCSFLVVATGLNAVPRIPANLPGLAQHFPPDTLQNPKNPDSSPMKRIHARDYKNGNNYGNKNVLVVGYGDSGIDICGDLKKAGATPYIVVNRKERTKEFYENAPKEEDGRIKWPFETNLSDLSKSVGNRGKCENGTIDPDCSLKAYACSDIIRFEENSVSCSGLDTLLHIDCVILATGYYSNVNDWLKSAEVSLNQSRNLQFNDTLDGMGMFSSTDNISGESDNTPSSEHRISAVGFNSKLGLHGLKSEVKEMYEGIEKE